MYFYALLLFIYAGMAAFVGFNDLAPDLTAMGRVVFYSFVVSGFALVLFALSRSR